MIAPPINRERKKQGVRTCLSALCLGAGLIAACAPMTRYRVLSFFFDGVPDPRAKAKVPEDEEKGTGKEQSLRALAALQQDAPRPEMYFHPPYKERKCNACHDMYYGKLIRPVEDGLCMKCHQAFRDERVFLHGPFAVNACLVCHHPHATSRPAMLNAPVEQLCLRCHWKGRFAGGKHPGGVVVPAGTPCTKCHDPHGGDTRFFLRKERAVPVEERG